LVGRGSRRQQLPRKRRRRPTGVTRGGRWRLTSGPRGSGALRRRPGLGSRLRRGRSPSGRRLVGLPGRLPRGAVLRPGPARPVHGPARLDRLAPSRLRMRTRERERRRIGPAERRRPRRRGQTPSLRRRRLEPVNRPRGTLLARKKTWTRMTFPKRKPWPRKLPNRPAPSGKPRPGKRNALSAKLRLGRRSGPSRKLGPWRRSGLKPRRRPMRCVGRNPTPRRNRFVPRKRCSWKCSGGRLPAGGPRRRRRRLMRWLGPRLKPLLLAGRTPRMPRSLPVGRPGLRRPGPTEGGDVVAVPPGLPGVPGARGGMGGRPPRRRAASAHPANGAEGAGRPDGRPRRTPGLRHAAGGARRRTHRVPAGPPGVARSPPAVAPAAGPAAGAPGPPPVVALVLGPGLGGGVAVHGDTGVLGGGAAAVVPGPRRFLCRRLRRRARGPARGRGRLPRGAGARRRVPGPARGRGRLTPGSPGGHAWWTHRSPSRSSGGRSTNTTPAD